MSQSTDRQTTNPLARERTNSILTGLLDEALSDERIKLPPRARVRLRHRLAELLDLDGWRLVRVEREVEQ